jgi:uncharacterized hydrophobic protein (TIGR00341 family)
MQIIEIHLLSGEGEKAARILKELGIGDFNLIKSESGDQLTIRHPLDKTNQITERFQEEFKFGDDENRGIILMKPDVVLPSEPDKERKVEEHSAKDCLIEYATMNSYADSKFIALMLFSAVVATLGLITDNIAVVVGAMIIAPAFGPISSIAIGVVVNRIDLLRDGIKTEMLGVGVAVTTAAIMGVMIPGIEVTPSLQLRMLPGIYDLLIGLAVGAAGGYVLVSGRNANIVGVMVAAALLPVMAAIGLSFIFLNPIYVFGSFLLLMINILTIILSMVLVFWFVGPQKEHIHLAHDYHLTQDAVKRFIRYVAVIIVVLAIPLIWLSYEDAVVKAPEKIIKTMFEKDFYDGLELGSVVISNNVIEITIYDYGPILEGELESIHEEIKRLIDPRYSIEFNIIESRKISF